MAKKHNIRNCSNNRLIFFYTYFSISLLLITLSDKSIAACIQDKYTEEESASAAYISETTNHAVRWDCYDTAIYTNTSYQTAIDACIEIGCGTDCSYAGCGFNSATTRVNLYCDCYTSPDNPDDPNDPDDPDNPDDPDEPDEPDPEQCEMLGCECGCEINQSNNYTCKSCEGNCDDNYFMTQADAFNEAVNFTSEYGGSYNKIAGICWGYYQIYTTSQSCKFFYPEGSITATSSCCCQFMTQGFINDCDDVCEMNGEIDYEELGEQIGTQVSNAVSGAMTGIFTPNTDPNIDVSGIQTTDGTNSEFDPEQHIKEGIIENYIKEKVDAMNDTSIAGFKSTDDTTLPEGYTTDTSGAKSYVKEIIDEVSNTDSFKKIKTAMENSILLKDNNSQSCCYIEGEMILFDDVIEYEFDACEYEDVLKTAGTIGLLLTIFFFFIDLLR